MNDDIYCDVFILYLMFSFNLASGIGDVYFAIQFLGDRCQVKMLSTRHRSMSLATSYSYISHHDIAARNLFFLS